MKTPTHAAINYLIVRKWNLSPFNQKMFVLGGIAPDVPICMLFVALWLILPKESLLIPNFSELYDHNLWVIGFHNVLHSPVSLALIWLLFHRISRIERSLTIFLLGSLSHSIIDVFTHVNDGPLIFWPLDWQFKFTSFISHWNFNHYGIVVMFIEATIILAALLLFFVERYLKRKGIWATY